MQEIGKTFKKFFPFRTRVVSYYSHLKHVTNGNYLIWQRLLWVNPHRLNVIIRIMTVCH